MMSLWFNLRRSLSQQVERTACNKNIKAITTIGDSADKQEVFTFPYGTKECVVYKEKGTNKLDSNHYRPCRMRKSSSSASSPTYSIGGEHDIVEEEEIILKFNEIGNCNDWNPIH